MKIALIALLTLLCSCSRNDTKFGTNNNFKISKISSNKSSSEIYNDFGAPSFELIINNKLTWYYVNYTLSPNNTTKNHSIKKINSISIEFNEDDCVEKITTN